jgi:hypothetical protein
MKQVKGRVKLMMMLLYLRLKVSVHNSTRMHEADS